MITINGTILKFTLFKIIELIIKINMKRWANKKYKKKLNVLMSSFFFSLNSIRTDLLSKLWNQKKKVFDLMIYCEKVIKKRYDV